MKIYSATTIRFIEALLCESASLLVRHGETRSDAHQRSLGFIMDFSLKLNGERIYFGKNSLLKAQMQRVSIRSDYQAGCTVAELASKYNLSTVSIYNTVREQKETGTAKPDTAVTAPLAVAAARMMIDAGIVAEDAVEAVRGLLAVVAARFAGTVVYLPKPGPMKIILKYIWISGLHKSGKSIRNISEVSGLSQREITTIIEAHPAQVMPNSKDLPILNKRLLCMAASFSDYSEISTLLEVAANNVSQAHEKIAAHKNMKGELEV
jgi:Mor family transcriptional regulator